MLKYVKKSFYGLLRRMTRRNKSLGKHIMTPVSALFFLFPLFLLPAYQVTADVTGIPASITHATKTDFDAGTKTDVEVLKDGSIMTTRNDGIIALPRCNMLINASFEGGTNPHSNVGAGWAAGSSAASEEAYIVDLDVNSYVQGFQSQKITFTSDSISGNTHLEQTVVANFDTGESYTLSAYVKIDNPDQTDAVVKLGFWNDDVLISENTSSPTSATSFTRISVTGTVPTGTNKIKTTVLMNTAGSGTTRSLWIDAVQLEKGTSTTQYNNGYTVASGQYISPPMDMGSSNIPIEMMWTSNAKAENKENIKIQLRSAATEAELGSAPWHGPGTNLPGANLIPNPGLESDVGIPGGDTQDDNPDDNIPDYSRQAQYGSATPVFTCVKTGGSDVYDGSRAVKVEYSNWTSDSGARWEILYNGTVRRDTEYLYSVWHKENGNIGTIPIAVALEYVDGSIDWTYAIKYVPTSNTWKKDELTFCTPIGKDVKNIWMRVSLLANGYVISDAYTLMESQYAYMTGLPNDLGNPGLESDVGIPGGDPQDDNPDDNIPDYSRYAQYGTATPVYTYIKTGGSDVHDGSRSVKVEYTNWVSGSGARWEVLYNGTVDRNTEYLYSVRHKENGDIGTTPIAVALEYADGTVDWSYAIKYVPTSNMWKKDELTFCTPPDKDVKNVWLRVSLLANGYIISDGYTLSKNQYAYITESVCDVKNPGLESDVGIPGGDTQDDNPDDNVPDYSRCMYYGSAAPAFTYVKTGGSDVYEGSRAVKVEYTDWVSGSAARWEVLFDGPVEKDADYVFGVWHKENANIGRQTMSVVLQYADGTINWAYNSKSIATSNEWKEDRLLFHTPCDKAVVKIWLKISLANNGYIITDAYSLKKINYCSEWKINPVHNNSEWIQYKVDFETENDSSSPAFHDITIKYDTSVPGIGWVNVLDITDARQKYAFKGGDTAYFNIEAIDFKGTSNLDHASITILDPNSGIQLAETNMATGSDINAVKRYYTYQYAFPGTASIGMWTSEIKVYNKEGQVCSEKVPIKIREDYTSPSQSMKLGIMGTDYGILKYKTYEDDIAAYSGYTGADMWKIALRCELLEPEHGNFNDEYFNAVLGLMDAASSSGAKVQLSLQQQGWPSWVNDGYADNQRKGAYEITERLASTWRDIISRSVNGRTIKDHPALDSYLIINEDNYVYDGDIYLRGLTKVAAFIRSVDTKLSHKIAIRPNTQLSYLRTRIAQGGIQDQDYGTGVYPTNSFWDFPDYESPVSESSYLRQARLRDSPVAYNGSTGVGETGFFKSSADGFGDAEKLLAFERSMKMAYEQGMDEFQLWGGGFAFADPATYFPKLKAYRDYLITQPRHSSSHFNVRVLIDNGEWLYTESSPSASALDMSIQPYRNLVKVLDEGGYSWFYTHSNATSLQNNVTYDTTITFSSAKNKTEQEVSAMLTGIIPDGSEFTWKTNLLENPGMENDVGIPGGSIPDDDFPDDNIPDYSRHMYYGTDADYYYITTGGNDVFEGSRSVKVEYADWTSGSGARWEAIYDGPVEKGADYLFSVWHKENGDIGTIPIAVALVYEDNTVDWSYAIEYEPTSADWKQSRLLFRTPTDKAVKMICLRLSLLTNGYIISDTYSLQK